MNDPKERTAWIKAQEAAADEDPHGYPEPGEPNESTEERMQRFFFQQMAEGSATANGDGAQLLTVTITLAEYRRLAQQDGKVEYLQEQLDKKEEALTFMHQKSIEDDKAASNYRRQIEDLNRDRRNLAENANIVANAIMSLAPAVPGLMADDAVFIASGIIDSRKDEVIAALEAAGLAVLEVKEKRGWECIVCKKA